MTFTYQCCQYKKKNSFRSIVKLCFSDIFESKKAFQKRGTGLFLVHPVSMDADQIKIYCRFIIHINISERCNVPLGDHYYRLGDLLFVFEFSIDRAILNDFVDYCRVLGHMITLIWLFL